MQKFNLSTQSSQWGIYKEEDIEMQEAVNEYIYEENMDASAMEVDEDTF